MRQQTLSATLDARRIANATTIHTYGVAVATRCYAWRSNCYDTPVVAEDKLKICYSPGDMVEGPRWAPTSGIISGARGARASGGR